MARGFSWEKKIFTDHSLLNPRSIGFFYLPKRLIFAALLLFVGFLLLSSARADTIILKNGRELTGVVIGETDQEVVLNLSFGNMTLQKSAVKEIKRDGRAPASPPEGIPASRPSSSSKSSTSSAEKKGKSIGKGGIHELAAELEQVTLSGWEYESHKVTETEKANYKVLRADGITELVMDKPKSSDGIEKLWMKHGLGRVDAGTVIYYTGYTGSSWRQLYWSKTGKIWTDDHPGLEAYKKMKRLSKELLKKIVITGGGNSTDVVKLESAANIIKSSNIMKEEAVAEANKNIAEITSRVGGSWGGAGILRQILSLDCLPAKTSQEEQIQVAREKRGLLMEAARKLK